MRFLLLCPTSSAYRRRRTKPVGGLAGQCNAGTSPFSLGIQINQMEEFKDRVIGSDDSGMTKSLSTLSPAIR